MRLFSSDESRRRSLNDCIFKLWHFDFSLLNNCSTLIILHFETMNNSETNRIRHLCRSTVSLYYDIGTIINKLSIEMFAFQRTFKSVFVFSVMKNSYLISTFLLNKSIRKKVIVDKFITFHDPTHTFSIVVCQTITFHSLRQIFL